jgi:hypothetical protein
VRVLKARCTRRRVSLLEASSSLDAEAFGALRSLSTGDADLPDAAISLPTLRPGRRDDDTVNVSASFGTSCRSCRTVFLYSGEREILVPAVDEFVKRSIRAVCVDFI